MFFLNNYDPVAVVALGLWLIVQTLFVILYQFGIGFARIVPTLIPTEVMLFLTAAHLLIVFLANSNSEALRPALDKILPRTGTGDSPLLDSEVRIIHQVRMRQFYSNLTRYMIVLGVYLIIILPLPAADYLVNPYTSLIGAILQFRHIWTFHIVWFFSWLIHLWVSGGSLKQLISGGMYMDLSDLVLFADLLLWAAVTVAVLFTFFRFHVALPAFATIGSIAVYRIVLIVTAVAAFVAVAVALYYQWYRGDGMGGFAEAREGRGGMFNQIRRADAHAPQNGGKQYRPSGYNQVPQV